MRKELDEALCAKYPLIFKDRHADMRTTAMCWGLECGDGWYNIIDILCGKLCSEWLGAKSRYEFIKDKVGQKMYGGSGDIITQGEIDLRKQIKEKFGGLRFYVNGATDKHWSYINFAESMSYRTCEECGAPGKTYTDGWHTTLCDVHAAMAGREEEYEYEENE